jgi:hydrophobic/amphiphilic exporter-1 (mainly G- bacteria), HAE1 family
MIKPRRRLFLFAGLTLLFAPPASRIPLSYLPEGRGPAIAVTVELKGSFAETVEESITVPLEEALYELPGLESISSVSQSEESRVLLLFDDRTSSNTAYLAVREAVDRASARFPEHAQRPRIDQNDPSARPVFVVALPPTDEEELRGRFDGIDGVGTVSLGGAARRELLVRPDYERLAAAGLSISDVVRELQAIGVLGNFQRAGESPLGLDTRPRRATEFGAFLLAPGVPLGSLAQVELSSAEKGNVSRINGRPTSVVTVTAAGGANKVALCRELRRTASSVPENEILYDYGRTVEEALSGAAVALGIGAVAVALSTLWFIRRPSAAAAVAGSVPFCALASLSTLSVLGMELDVLSLAGIAVGVGLVVDAGAVYLGFHRQSAGDQPRALKEARSPVVLGGLTTVVVFLPLVFAPPSLSKQYVGLAVAIVSSVSASVLYVLGLLPALLALGKAPGNGGSGPLPLWFSTLFERITGLRRWSRIPFFLAAVAAPVLLVWLPRDSEPAVDDGLLRVTLEYPARTTLAAVEGDAARLEERLVGHPGVHRVAVTFEEERARFEIDATDPAEVRHSLKEEAARGHLSGFLFYPDETPEEVRIPILVTAENSEDARRGARKVARAVEALAGTQGVVLHFKESPGADVVRLDLEAARLQGIAPGVPPAALYWSLAGPVATKWRPPGDEIDVRVLGRGLAGGELLSKVFVSEAGGSGSGASGVPALSALASLTREPDVGRIHRHNRRHSARLSVLTDRKAAGDTAMALRDSVGGLDLPRGVSVTIDPEAGDRESEGGSLLLMGALSLFLVLVTILAAFESLAAVSFCLLQLPLSWLLPAIYLGATGSALTPAVALALVVTSGIAVNNTILVLHGRPKGNARGALRRAASPIITATATTVAGLLPLLFVPSASLLASVAVVLSLGSVGSLGALALTLPGSRIARSPRAPGSLHTGKRPGVVFPLLRFRG